MKKFALIVGVVLVLFLYGVGVLQVYEYKNSAGATQSAEQVKTEAKYIVKEHNGQIAVFVGDDTIPIKILNIDVSQLREYDKQQFKKGITLNTLSDVLMLEEDFSS